jgi:effector-binding domain-containing protein
MRRLSSVPPWSPKPPSSTVIAALLGINVNYLLTGFVVGKRDNEVLIIKRDNYQTIIHKSFSSEKVQNDAILKYLEEKCIKIDTDIRSLLQLFLPC